MYSSLGRRMPTQMSCPTSARTAWRTSRRNRIRFSSDPPYSSVRTLLAGDRNCSIRYPDDACTSIPSSPPSRQRRAAAAKASTCSAIIEWVISTGMTPIIGLGMALAEIWPDTKAGGVADPGW